MFFFFFFLFSLYFCLQPCGFFRVYSSISLIALRCCCCLLPFSLVIRCIPCRFSTIVLAPGYLTLVMTETKHQPRPYCCRSIDNIIFVNETKRADPELKVRRMCSGLLPMSMSRYEWRCIIETRTQLSRVESSEYILARLKQEFPFRFIEIN